MEDEDESCWLELSDYDESIEISITRDAGETYTSFTLSKNVAKELGNQILKLVRRHNG